MTQRIRKRARASQEDDPDFAPGNHGPRKEVVDGKGRAEAYRGVTHHIRTNRFEAHLWENGKQLYLGGYDSPQLAALAFDLAAIRYRGIDAATNYDPKWYQGVLGELQKYSPEAIVAGLRRHSKGESVQSSIFKGVTRHQKGRWEARIGQTVGKKYQYLGLHDTEVQAAKAYDLAAIKRTGIRAITNFHLVCYLEHLSEEQVKEALKEGIITEDDIIKNMGDDKEAPAAELPAAVNGLRLASENGSEKEEVPTAEYLHRTTTTSTEDALAGALFDTITKGDVPDLSPQTVLPRGRTQSNAPLEGASATKPSRGKVATRSVINRDEWPREGVHIDSPRILNGLDVADQVKDNDHINWEHLARELFS